ncbi:MAG TPA: nucleotide exchange factor GrpE [Rhizomicrobium sp.]|nr:nucleotide exchange factor GrpE [Rhizomicrobium sp.]
MSEETEQEMPEARMADPANDSGPDTVAVLKAEVESLRDQRLRALAEAENIRRRAEREKTEASQYAVTKFARDMVSIADNFSRALAACPPELRDAADPQVKAVLDGVEATDRQLMATLERYGVKPVSTENGKFDPNLHQAIAEVPGNGKPPGTIIDVVQAGYMIGDRLLRPAMVTVARRDTAPVDTKV